MCRNIVKVPNLFLGDVVERILATSLVSLVGEDKVT
jgi:hypothetical protein